MVTHAKTPKPVSTAGRTVVVACKIPAGIWMQLQRPLKKFEDTRDGPVARTYYVFTGRKIYINGPAYPVGTILKGFPRAPLIEGGYAVTTGIPADFWEQWAQQNKLADFFMTPDGAEHGMIFAYPDLDSVVSAAREQEKLLSGLEPISTDEDKNGHLTDPRLPRPINASVAKVGTEPHPAAQGG